MFSRLLLAVDDSPGSEVATAFAVALARHHASSVHVFHVNQYLVGGRGVTMRTQAEVKEFLMGTVDHLRAAGITTTGSAVRGTCREVPRRIVATANQRGSDTIVLGSEPHQRLGRLFSPHVRARTIRLTTLPVVTAPTPLDMSATARLTVEEVVRQQFEFHKMMPPP